MKKERKYKEINLNLGTKAYNFYSRSLTSTQSLFISSVVQFTEQESNKINHSITLKCSM